MSSRIVERLAQELRAGRYADATRLPAETELAQTMGVSRTVIRDALRELEREGYVERVRGIGTVVNRAVVALEHRIDQKLEFYSMIRAMGKIPHSDHVLSTRQEAGESSSKALGIALGTPVLSICKRVFADTTPVIYSTDIVPLTAFGSQPLEKIDFSQPVFSILRRYTNTQAVSSVAHLHAVPGDISTRRLLSLSPDKALLLLEETCYSRRCEPVLHCRTYYTDFFDFAILRKLL